MHMRSLVFTLPLITFVACNGDESDSGGEDPVNTCTTPISVASTLPDDGATGVYVGDTIEVTFSAADEGATLTLLTPDGSSISGTSTWRGPTLVFEPDAQLEPETRYTATVDFSCGNPTFAFTTSATGKALTVELDGRTYDMSLDGARILQPDGVQDLVEGFVSADVLVGVMATSPALSFLGGIAAADSDPLTQDACVRTVPFPDGDLSASPTFKIGPGDSSFAVGDADLTIYDLELSGTFTADGTGVDGIKLSGLADTRNVGAAFSDSATEETACNLADAAGVECEPCPDGENYCITIEIDRLTATEIPGLTMEEVTNVCANAACSEEEECQDAPA